MQVLNQAKKDFYNTGVKINGDVQTSSVLDRIKLLDGNSCCCDCGREEADWLVTNLGVLVCIYCCGIHRDLGVHVSKTQSIKIDRLSPTQLIVIIFFKFKIFIEKMILSLIEYKFKC